MASDPREILDRKRKTRRPLTTELVAAPSDHETPLDRVNRDLAILNMRLHGLTFHEIARKLPEAGFRRVSVSRDANRRSIASTIDASSCIAKPR